MSEVTFTMWLQGWVELNGGKMPTVAQWDMIKEHLALSFNKVTAPLGGLPSIPKLPFKDQNLPYPSFYPPFDHNRFFLDVADGGTIPPGTLIC